MLNGAHVELQLSLQLWRHETITSITFYASLSHGFTHATQCKTQPLAQDWTCTITLMLHSTWNSCNPWNEHLKYSVNYICLSI